MKSSAKPKKKVRMRAWRKPGRVSRSSRAWLCSPTHAATHACTSGMEAARCRGCRWRAPCGLLSAMRLQVGGWGEASASEGAAIRGPAEGALSWPGMTQIRAYAAAQKTW